MAHKNLACALVSAAVMLLLPYLAVTLIKGDGDMAICFLLFYAVDPLWSVSVGLFAGRNIKVSWFQPLVSAALFLAGAWLLFDRGESDFLLYTAAYFAVGVFSMLVTFLLVKRKI